MRKTALLAITLVVLVLQPSILSTSHDHLVAVEAHRHELVPQAPLPDAESSVTDPTSAHGDHGNAAVLLQPLVLVMVCGSVGSIVTMAMTPIGARSPRRSPRPPRAGLRLLAVLRV